MKRVQDWFLVWRGIRSQFSGEGHGGHHDNRWYSASDLHWRVVSVLAAIVIALACLVEASPWGKGIEDRLARPLQFRFRSWLDRAPKLDPRIQIYSFDDASLAYLKADDIALSDWATLFDSYRNFQPRAIFVDMTFDMPRGPETAEAFIKKLRKLPFPIVAGCNAFPRPIPERDTLVLGGNDYRLDAWSGSNDAVLPSWFKLRTSSYAYGPIFSLLPILRVGQISRDFDVEPLMPLMPERVLPLAPLLIAKAHHLDRAGLVVDGKPVPVGPDGHTLANLPSRTELEARTTSILSLITRFQAGRPVPEPPADAVIVILPRTVAGTEADAHKYVMTAIVNSVLTGQWIRRVPFAAAQIAFFGLAGMLIGALLSGMWFWLATMALAAIITFSGLFIFSWLGFELPWCLSCLSFLTTALVVCTDRSASKATRSLRLRASLHGMVPDATIDRLLAHPKTISFEPTGKTLTVMYVDVAGVSQAIEKLTPTEGFARLQELNRINSAIVHKHGGIVDRTLGDGMLCLFGHSFDTSGEEHDQPNAARQALECAMEIQERCLDRAVQAAAQGAPVFPLRIGLNTDFVYIGDTGTGKKLDFAVIGDGVNAAKLLEAACESFRILIAPATLKALPPTVSARLNPARRDIRLNNHDALAEAYECNPYSFQPEMRQKAENEFRRFASLQRVHERWAVPMGVAIPVVSPLATGKLHNISETGFCVDFDRYLGIGVPLELNFEFKDPQVAERLRRQGLLPVKTEVRWGTPAGDTCFRHGLLIRDLDDARRKELVATIRKAFDLAPMMEPQKKAA